MLKAASSAFSLLFLVPTLLVFWNFAILTTIASSFVLTVRVVAVYSGLALAVLRRNLRRILFPHDSYSASASDPQLAHRVKVTFNTNTSFAAKQVNGSTDSPRKISGSGKRRRARTPLGPKRVDYTTLLRPKRQDSQNDYFGMWEAVVAKNR